VQAVLVDVLVDRVVREVETSGIQVIALAGGVSANTALRERMLQLGALHGWQVHIPPMSYCTDNAAMVGAAARMVYPPENPSPWGLGPDPRMPF
jgi:N6-L-threonylcarbamoyladenine synthase